MWHLKERFDCRLYSGPLSLEAQKILQALQAQRRHATRQNASYAKHNRLLENGQYGGQWEPLSQSFTSQEQEKNSQSQWHYSEVPAFSQSSQTLDLCKMSQASCSSGWDTSLRQINQRESHNLSHGYSKGKNLETLSPQSSQVQSFTQCDLMEPDSSLSQSGRYTLSLQTPQSFSEQHVAPWKSSEEVIPFTIKFPPEGLNKLYPKKNVKDKTEEPIVPSLYEMNSSVIDKWPAMDRTKNIPQKGLSATPKPGRLNLALESELKCELYLTSQFFSKGLDAPEHISQVRHNNKNTEVPVVEKELVQPALSEDRISPPLPESKDISGSCSLSESCNVIETSDIPLTGGSPIRSDSRNALLLRADADLTTGEATDVMEVEVKMAQEVIEEATMKEAYEAATDCSDDKLDDRQCKSIDIDQIGQAISLRDKKLKMPIVNNQSESLQSGECCECNDNAYTNAVVPEDARPHLFKVPCDVQRETMVNYLQEQFVATPLNSSSSHCLISSSMPQNESSNLLHSTSKLPHPLPLKPSFTLKRKREAPQSQSAHNISSKAGSTRCPPKWEPPRSSQEQKRDARKKTDKNKIAKCNEEIKHSYTSADCTPPKQSRYTAKPNKHGTKKSQPVPSQEFRNQTKFKPESLTSSLTSDPRVIDASKISQEDIVSILKKAQLSVALLLTMVFRDGTTLLDPEQKQTPPVCGLLLLIKTDLDTVLETLGPNDTLVYLKLEHVPTWAQHSTHHLQEMFTRDLLLQLISASQLVVCYKAKDVLLQLYKMELTWKQVEGCQIQDPHVSGWLLDPTDPATCFQNLLNKHCREPRITPALGSKKVSQIIACLYSLYKLNRQLCSKLQSQGLWRLYTDMELKMIPVLAAMEVCHIHVDKKALRRTSDLLGTKMKQLEQEAHKAAGQMFLLTSSTQLRTVLFEKLRLHEQCENKKLPKTINKQQSTSEAALLQLQDLHPLPKIILEYRQIHKIKSTFVDGILSCMMTKNYISSTWHQTSVVTGRISATHPNFQALPRHPLQVTRKLYIAGKEEEVVTVHPRAMFIPKEGWTFLSADFCQVELRLLAHLSSDPELLRVFTNPEADVFSMLASQWKGVSETAVSSEDREHAKRIVYSVVYGAGPERLSGILGVSTEQARRFQDSFLQTYKEVQNFIQKTITECQKKVRGIHRDLASKAPSIVQLQECTGLLYVSVWSAYLAMTMHYIITCIGYVLSIMGRRRTLHNINSPDWGVRMQAERQAVNFVVQGSAADLCKMAMIRIINLLSTSNSLSARLIAQLHDELLYEVEDSQVEKFAAVVKSTMESLEHIDQLNVHLKVPLKVAVSSGKSWGSMSELNIPQSHPSF